MGEVQKLKGKEKFAYGIGAVGKDMVYMLSASYVLYYYQDIMGVSAVAMGVILFIARIFDAFNDPIMEIPSVALYRDSDKCNRAVPDVRRTTSSFRQWTGCLCGCYLHTLGRNLYDDGHSILVHDSGFYRKWKRTRKSFGIGTFLCRRWFCHHHDHHRTFRIHAWQAGRREKCIGN